MTLKTALGVDIGGTDTKIAIVDEHGAILEHASIPTRPGRGARALITEVADVASRFTADFATVGVAAPGPMDLKRQRVIASPNLPGWTDTPLQSIATDTFNKPVVLENDANCAAFGEFILSRDPSDIVLLTLGTGIGAGAVIGGSLLRGARGNASEWGHLIVEPDGRPCPCGQRGCLERYASATAVVADARERIAGGAKSVLTETTHLTAKLVFDAAASNDPTAVAVVDSACHYLGLACVAIQHALNPHRIVFGGGMSVAGEPLRSGIQRHFDSLRWSAHDDFPTLSLAQLGLAAGVIGAAALTLTNS
jgi:glucokinase